MDQKTLPISDFVEKPTELVEEIGELVEVSMLAERLDFLDVQVLRKFYMNGKDFPFDTQPHCFPILYREMKTTQKIKIGSEGLRKRLDVLVGIGLLEKIKGSNPISYSPIIGKSGFVRGVITKFFLINGLMKFL
jgi:hypothetical protein